MEDDVLVLDEDAFVVELVDDCFVVLEDLEVDDVAPPAAFLSSPPPPSAEPKIKAPTAPASHQHFILNQGRFGGWIVPAGADTWVGA